MSPELALSLALLREKPTKWKSVRHEQRASFRENHGRTAFEKRMAEVSLWMARVKEAHKAKPKPAPSPFDSQRAS